MIVDVGSDPLSEDLAQAGAAGGLKAELQQREVAGAEGGDAADELAHQLGAGLSVAVGRLLVGDRGLIGWSRS
ncbi:hypothetical protein GCM10010346_64610 [Streptomyces chryseus]|uniref:Uncharacterized protein n=1 Tax=Streptomyces chryseus TaxID=68186 RepID=A0ABQ3EBC0_9ACTN|nr:hypothetical protein GCM10010346_64610 [Streptomyces chryseus]